MKRFVRYFVVYFNNLAVRRNLGILVGLLFNFFYVIFNLILGIKQENVWFITVASYYMLVSVLRYFLLDGAGEGEWCESREGLVGYLMLILSVPMTGMILYTVLTGSIRSYPIHSLPVIAAYALFGIFRSVHGLFFLQSPQKRRERLVYSVRLSLALTSLFNLQGSLFSFLSLENTVTLTLNFVLGGAVSLSMLFIAYSSRKKIAKQSDI